MRQEKKDVVDWLLECDQPAIRYSALTELLDKPVGDSEVEGTRKVMSQEGWVGKILQEQLPRGYWYSYVSLHRPKYLATIYRLLVLADLGATIREPRVKKACELFLTNSISKDGGFAIKSSNTVQTNDYPSHFCVTGNIARALIQCGYEDDPRVHSALSWLTRVQKDDGGWHCFPSVHGTLDGWEALSAFAALPRTKWTRSIKKSAERGAEFYLERHLYREGRKVYEPWLRFHYPIHYYYDLLVGLDILTALGYSNDRRLRFALKLLHDKRRPDGKWILDSVHPDIAPGDQYQMKPPFEPEPPIAWALEWIGEPSKVITLKALRVLRRVEESSSTNISSHTTYE